MNQSTKNALVSAAIAGILSVGTIAKAGDKAAAKPAAGDAKGKCEQSNKCKGNGACASVKEGGNECAGHNSCHNHVFKGTKAECDKVKGKWSKG